MATISAAYSREGSVDDLPAIVSGGAFGGGTLANILQGIKQNSYQNQILNLFKNPGQLAALVAKLQQPLNNGLTQAVGNQVQGNLAERGLSQAPGVFAASESQALAPYYQQNQNEAMNAVMQLLGMPAGTFKNPVNNSGALSAFLKYLPGQNQNNTGPSTYTPTIFDPSSPWLPPPSDSTGITPDWSSTWSAAPSGEGDQ
jgi:hypothetical protein